jgi:hypothetical protein
MVLLLVALVVFVIVLLVKRPKAGAIVLIGLAGVAVLGGGFFFLTPSVPVPPSSMMQSELRSQTQADMERFRQQEEVRRAEVARGSSRSQTEVRVSSGEPILVEPIRPAVSMNSSENVVEAVNECGGPESTPASGGALAAGSAGPEWSPESAGGASTPGGAFEADIYPSARSAAAALGNKLKPMIDSLRGASAPPPESIRVLPGAGTAPDQEVLIALREALSAAMPGARCYTLPLARSSTGPTRESNCIDVLVSVTREMGGTGIVETIEFGGNGQGPITRIRPPAAHGEVTAKASDAKGGSAFAILSYVDKPWAESLSKFVSTNPGHVWLVGSSREACTSQEDAQKQAYRQLAGQLEGPVATEMNRRGPWSSDNWNRQRLSLIDRIESEIRKGGFVSDQFAQQFPRPYGNVWKQRLLMDASAAKIGALADRLYGEAARQAAGYRTAWLRTVLSAAGIAVLICLVYLLLNAVTKGYYVWRLRAVALVLALSVAFLLLVVS